MIISRSEIISEQDMKSFFAYLKRLTIKEKSFADNWFQLDERLRFVTVGLANTVVRYLIFVGLGLWLSVEHYQYILLASWLLSSVTAFLAYKLLVFKTEGEHLKEYLKSLLIWAISYFLNAGILKWLVGSLNMNAYLAQAAAIAVITVINYLLFKHYAFKQKKIGFFAKLYGVFD